ncbi:hypothetical protein HDU98_004983 [Podochytrium sp. JEL0797]|nr:hypothetical protein HDU98_004983 [Podochytrium sp. JEL0797]
MDVIKKLDLNTHISPTHVSTIPFPPAGYKIVSQMGIVRGVTCRSRNLVANIGSGFKSLVGGQNLTQKKLAEDTRIEAYNFMVEEAFGFGANCIIGVQYECCMEAGGISEVLCYGTAVKIELI